MPDFIEPTPELFAPPHEIAAAWQALEGNPAYSRLLAWTRQRITERAASLQRELETVIEQWEATFGRDALPDALAQLGRGRKAEADRAEILRIVSAWCVESNDQGGIDAGDLAWRLEQAGYPLPEED